jgi:hypothetical protein
VRQPPRTQHDQQVDPERLRVVHPDQHDQAGEHDNWETQDRPPEDRPHQQQRPGDQHDTTSTIMRTIPPMSGAAP